MNSFRTLIALLISATILIACGGGGGSTPTAATPPVSTIPLADPGPNWSLNRVTPADVGVTQIAVDGILTHIFTDQAVQAGLLVKDGLIIGERYATGHGAEDFVTSWSVAKSFYSAAVGIAIGEGWISSLDQRASDFLTEWQGTGKADITIRNLLEMRGGLPADDDIFFEADQSAYAINLPLASAPGSIFVYSNPTAQLFEPLLLRATGMNAHAYLAAKVLTPIGIDTNNTGLWFDAGGANPMTYCCIDMRPEDFARFGLLYARDGEWAGTQIVPATYVTESLTAQSSFYGLQWWILNSAYFGTTVPITISAALGLDGQRIYVWPEEDVVLVVFTLYEHFANQGYVLDTPDNYPNTCSGRNSCPSSTGPSVAFYNQLELIELLADLQ